eukprot:616495-Pyramimonas_sp.AAC.1
MRPQRSYFGTSLTRSFGPIGSSTEADHRATHNCIWLVFPNHPAMLGPRFEETAPRVSPHLTSRCPLPLLPSPTPASARHMSTMSAHPSRGSWPHSAPAA